MIQKLRRRFIAAAMLALTIVLIVLLGTVNLVSFRKTVSDADTLLELLSENQGAFPMHMFRGKELPRDRMEPRRDFSPETPYESRFFSVTLDAQGEVLRTDIANIAAVDMASAAEFANNVLQSGKTKGFLGEYRFLAAEQLEQQRIIFLDCGRTLSSFRTTLLASFGVAAGGLLAVFLLLLMISGRIVKPVAESYEKQRQFITDAGHELKTPLTIIQADADLLEMEYGESEWLEDIRRQAQRLAGLTGDLITLSRMDEAKQETAFVEFPLSDVVEETAQSFLGLARQQGKYLMLTIQPMITLTGSEKALRQLVSILLDNALKYSPDGSQLFLRLEKDNRTIRLQVENTTRELIEKEKLKHLFERFYRLDSSRNASAGGYGLGLAIARGIVQSHRGKIRAESLKSDILTVTASFPAAK